jgi:hypothetical protein
MQLKETWSNPSFPKYSWWNTSPFGKLYSLSLERKRNKKGIFYGQINSGMRHVVCPSYAVDKGHEKMGSQETFYKLVSSGVKQTKASSGNCVLFYQQTLVCYGWLEENFKTGALLYSIGSQSVVPRAAAVALPENLLEVQSPGPHNRPIEPGTGGQRRCSNLYFINSSPDDSYAESLCEPLD